MLHACKHAYFPPILNNKSSSSKVHLFLKTSPYRQTAVDHLNLVHMKVSFRNVLFQVQMSIQLSGIHKHIWLKVVKNCHLTWWPAPFSFVRSVPLVPYAGGRDAPRPLWWETLSHRCNQSPEPDVALPLHTQRWKMRDEWSREISSISKYSPKNCIDVASICLTPF